MTADCVHADSVHAILKTQGAQVATAWMMHLVKIHQKSYRENMSNGDDFYLIEKLKLGECMAYAVKHDIPEMVTLVWSATFNADTKDFVLMRAIHQAAQQNNLVMIDLLTDYVLQVCNPEEEGVPSTVTSFYKEVQTTWGTTYQWSPIETAAYYGHCDAIDLLVNRGWKLGYDNDWEGEFTPPVHAAVYGGQQECVKHLVSVHNQNIFDLDTDQLSVLYYVQDPDMVRFLAGMSVFNSRIHYESKKKPSPLFVVENPATFEELLRYRVDVTQQDEEQQTILYHVRDKPELFELLFKYVSIQFNWKNSD